jgi:hypothetical protein
MRPWVASALAGVLTFLACYALLQENGTAASMDERTSSTDRDHEAKSSSGAADYSESDEAKLVALRKKLQPKDLQDEDGILVKHQFLHLHHMKTAGTCKCQTCGSGDEPTRRQQLLLLRLLTPFPSHTVPKLLWLWYSYYTTPAMDGLLKCAMKRLEKDMGYHDMAYMNIHECGERRYERCLSGQDERCREQAAEASIMSYCAPLKDLEVFEWKATANNPIHALTVLRHPVARVWSMYRFRTKDCYQCRTLKEVYNDIDHGTTAQFADGMCATQLQNHQTRNLVMNQEATESELVEQAIMNLENFFTVIGLTEDIVATAQITGHVFPWMAERVNGTTSDCPFPHRNSSPQNNHCGADGGHLELPASPDEETEALIRQYNQLDIQVYDAAVKHFQLQKKALGL